MDAFFIPVVLAAVIGGSSASLAGVYVVGMRIPFISVCMSHAAMLGAVFGSLFGFSVELCALFAAVLSAIFLGVLPSERLRLGHDITVSILFSLSMGLIFLGIGLAKSSKAAMLGLLWGNLLFVDMAAMVKVSAAAVLLSVFVWQFSGRLKSILFSRSLSAAAGVHETLVYTLFLVVLAAVVTVNLQAVGGLMLFSLIVSPAAAAYQVSRGYRRLLITAAIFGGLSALLGFLASYYLNPPDGLPTGACIVIVSTLIFIFAAAIRYFFKTN